MRKFSVLLLLVLIFTLSFSALAVEVGETLPDFEAQDLEGNTVNISDYQGQYVLYDAWATWCGPCKKAMTAYVQNIDKFKEAGVKIVALSVDAKLKAPKEYVEEKGIPFTVIHDNNKQAGKKWGVRGIPTMFFVDPEGKVIFKEVGFSHFAEVWEKITSEVEVAQVSEKTPELKADEYPAKAVVYDLDKISKDLSLDFIDYSKQTFVSKDDFKKKLTAEPEYKNEPTYGTVELLDKTFIMAAVNTDDSKFKNLIYVDFNGNKDLTDDEPIEMEDKGNYTSAVFNLEVEINGSTVPFMLECYSTNNGEMFYTFPAMGYKGKIESASGSVSFMIVDKNINGQFGDKEDAILLDLDENGIYDSYSAQVEWVALDDKLELGNNTYKFKVKDNGQMLIVEEVK